MPQGDGWITYSHVWWSEDAGASWNVSGGFGASTAEGSVVELFDEPAGQHLLSAGRMDLSPACMVDGKREACPDSFFMNCTLEAVGGGRRRDAAVPHCRRLSRSSNGGRSWTQWHDAADLPDPACERAPSSCPLDLEGTRSLLMAWRSGRQGRLDAVGERPRDNLRQRRHDQAWRAWASRQHYSSRVHDRRQQLAPCPEAVRRGRLHFRSHVGRGHAGCGLGALTAWRPGDDGGGAG